MDIKTDILVLGSGLAGVLFSLELASKRPDLRIGILSKNNIQNSSSYLAQGGIAAVLPESEDLVSNHVQDTLRAGSYTNNPKVVEHFISRSGKAIALLERWGIAFDKNPGGTKDLALEGGHSERRILHHKDFTGKYIMEILYAQLSTFSNIQIYDNTEALGLLQNESKGVEGALLWNSVEEKAYELPASAVVMATGGLGSLFEYSTNPTSALGQGIAMAAMAGAEIADLMNIQFHPTAFWKSDGKKLPLISEAIRGAGAILRNQTAYPFMMDRHPLKDLAPRDVVSRSIVEEIEVQDQPFVNLDCRNISQEEWKNHFPGILQICCAKGVDPLKAFIPVVPAAHYSCGGIKTDVLGKTNLKNLYVLGESANTGFHGSNRLASNSLLEAVCMSYSLADEIAKQEIDSKGQIARNIPEWKSNIAEKLTLDRYLGKIRKTMQQHCAVIKTIEGLLVAKNALADMQESIPHDFPLNSIERKSLELSLYTAIEIVESSLQTKENRGVFYNKDFEKSKSII